MIDDVDWKLLNERIESIERSIEMLKALFPEKPKPIEISDIQIVWDEITNPKYIAGKTPCMYDTVDPSKAMGLVCSCPKCSPYALSFGSLTSPDTKQIWRNKDDE